MSNQSLITWGLPRLSQLLPLDEDSLTQIITYSATLSKEASADHLKNLLGDSPAALEFITSFNSRRAQRSSSPDRPPTSTSATETKSESRAKKTKKTKPPLHTTGPPRRPENYGNVAGGYMKADRDEEYIAAASSRKQDTGKGTGVGALELSTEPAALQLPFQSSSPSTSRAQSPAPNQSTKPPPSASGPMVSDLLPNVKSKTAKQSRHGTPRTASPSKGSLTTNNINDLTAAIAALEVSTNPTLGKGRQKCTCYASIHPLFTPAPNCLNCGKIICALEGLQPCSFCGTPLLSADEIQSMIRELRAERGQEKMRAHNEGHQRDSSPGVGSSNQLDAAKAHRDKLLQFQAQNAKRTRVVDEAADFETPNLAATLWMSPAQRALALKKQQRVLREMEDKARPEWEKKKTIMSLDIKGGRVTRVYQSAGEAAPSSEDAEAEAEAEAMAEEDMTLEEDGKPGSGRAFSRNPLLAAGGLMRPVWKNPEGKEVQSRRDKKQTWRRVQDDRDDNEQWILDGGLHGYTS
ncbi:C2HC5 finger protein [Aspergillus sclerotialis]|uniref:C2HC5 finger protein n=1 Tax=Aspergillus sclerotialis TaxID=2070753 RepID=A0A3A2Z4U2_9EURO|nr:C2HC5 finger protein [Aspergillus sclerotialis]